MTDAAHNAETNAAHFKFRVQGVFPPANPMSVPLLRLMAATNDVRFLQRLTLQYQQWQTEAAPLDEMVIGWEIAYLFRLLCGHLYEAGVAFQDLDAEHGAVLDGIVAAHPEAVDALRNLRQIYGGAGTQGNLFIRLKTIRDEGVFHYDPRACNRIINDRTCVGELVVTELSGFSRYILADVITQDVILKATGWVERNLGEHISGVLAVARWLDVFVADLLTHFLEKGEQGILEYKKGKIQIPPALVRARKAEKGVD